MFSVVFTCKMCFLTGTPKSRGTKELDTSLSNSPSLRKADQTKPKVMFTGVTDEQSEKVQKSSSLPRWLSPMHV